MTENTPSDRSTKNADRPKKVDIVEETLEGTFPASDPPSWNPLHAGPPRVPLDRGRSTRDTPPDADAR